MSLNHLSEPTKDKWFFRKIGENALCLKGRPGKKNARKSNRKSRKRRI
jgi:hypothetical protein